MLILNHFFLEKQTNWKIFTFILEFMCFFKKWSMIGTCSTEIMAHNAVQGIKTSIKLKQSDYNQWNNNTLITGLPFPELMSVKRSSKQGLVIDTNVIKTRSDFI